MSEGGHKGEYTYPDEEDDLDWWAEQRLNIREIRMMYSSISHYQSNWEKYNAGRPPEEMEFLTWYRTKLFSMISDYNFTHHEVEDTTSSSEET